MAATTLCPKCSQAVAIPQPADAAMEVRCPLCQAEYVLSEALTDDAPALIVLSVPTSSSLQPDPLQSTPSSGAAISENSNGDASALDFTYVEGEGSAILSPSTLEQAEAAAEGSSPDGDLNWNSDSVGDSQPAEPSFSDAADTSVGTTVVSSSTTSKKKRRGPGAFGKFVGIVLSGFVGIALAYFLVRWIKPSAAAEIDQTIATYLPWWKSIASTPVPNQQQPNSAPSEKRNAGPPLVKEPPPQVSVNELQPMKPAPVESAPSPKLEAPAPPAEIPFTGPVSAQKIVTPAELGAALTIAKEAVAKKPSEVSPEEFKALCDVGHAVALVADPSGAEASELRRTAAGLLGSATAPTRREKLGYYAHIWLFDNRRPPDRPGVWLVGRVEKIDTLKTARGNLVESRIAVRGKNEAATVSVLSVERPDYHVGDTAGILGTIVTEPSTQLPWYTGTEPRVVLSGVAIGLPVK
ncbi:MAG: hypothetical protein K8T91_00435 [Planctomycetes bacterium]|nr:hypothetical protein [Planctomycetota bacterium]